MPTGYTSSVQDGSITTLRAFAMSCARAFGALISMRDDPSDAAIPDALAPSPYHYEQLADANARLKTLLALSDAEIEAASKADYADALSRYAIYKNDMAAQRERYESMLSKVRAWSIDDGANLSGLKEFMERQLVDSISHDCNVGYLVEPKEAVPHEWIAGQIKECSRDISYHTKEYAKEVARTNERNAWLNNLRLALSNTSEPRP